MLIQKKRACPAAIVVLRYFRSLAEIHWTLSPDALHVVDLGDALGHPFEYITVTDDTGTSHFDLSTLEFHGEFNKFACQRGQWTDDASMGLCMADSFILRRGFDGSDMRKRFWCWWFRGYNNAFRKDTARSSKKSIGLGGNTQKSLEPLDAFADGGQGGKQVEGQVQFDASCLVGDVPPVYDSASEDAGNGSLMRLVTSSPARETERCWNWKHETLDIAGTLAARGWSYNGYPVSADYFGSYSWPSCSDWLDGLAGALWAVYHSRSFDEAVVRAVNLNGDADSFGSMAGQIAGAFYGFSAINKQFVEWLSRWDDHETAVRALLLFKIGADVEKTRGRDE
ncbi:ADP-ribosylarginine hydrolase Tri1 (Immunity protein Tri1) (Tri1-Pp) [Durusdinium trenchii]|uniref:ADP-ribosylhydrolase ARH3 n=1 Tax=Durusdinium trenchii TaxID=1381693 RepID=A0ABP0QF38_9DINO